MNGEASTNNMVSNDEEGTSTSETIGLSELGPVTKHTKGVWLGLFFDGGVPPFCRELLPLSMPDQND